MGCPIAMGRSSSADASSHSLFSARVPQSGCNGDFVIDCGGMGGTVGIVTVTYFADFVHVCASATYQLVLVRCMAWICMRPSLAGWGSPENC